MHNIKTINLRKYLIGEIKLEHKQRALQVIDQNAVPIADIGDSIWSFTEIGMQEYETHDLLTGVLSQENFRIDPIVGFPTAVMATYGSSKPVIAVHTGFDAVPSGSQAACNRGSAWSRGGAQY
jgi:aminobenzoyl-glutamate utilization protein B